MKKAHLRTIIQSVILLFPYILLSQQQSSTYRMNYIQFENGKQTGNEIETSYSEQIVFLSDSADKIKHYTDFKHNENVSTITFEDNLYKNVTPFSDLPKPIFKDTSAVILGYNCALAKYSYFSNSIDVWFTEEATIKGSPYSRFLPSNKALVLKIIVNGNREIVADSITEIQNQSPPEYLADQAQLVTDAEFEEIKINSRFISVPIFKDETINFNPSILPSPDRKLKENHTYHFSKGSVILKKIKLTPELCNSGHVFARLQCRSNGDAYDRTGTVFIVPEDESMDMLDAYQFGLDTLPVIIDNNGNEYQGIRKEDDYNPPVEILRFFTSFGADHFNEKRKINNYNWAEDVVYKQEVTALIPNEEQEIWVGVFIGNYDKGGHKVSLELDFYPGFGEDENPVRKYIQPLFLTVNTMEMSGQNYGKLFNNDTLHVDFDVPDNIENLQLLYTTTGHGGWGGGDEFNPKVNQVLIDGEEVFSIIPWRTDCATYRLLNPASGNFGNGLSSSDLSRSNWCPGTLTPPYIVPLNDLEPGKHCIEVIIDQGDDEGSSFNHWGVSGILTAKVISSD